jgi:hypothetical protein
VAAVVTPMTLLSPVRRGRRWRLRLVFALARRFPPKDIGKLTVIHVANWSLLDRLPQLDLETQPPEDLPGPYLVFISNFNGPTDDYVDLFSEEIPTSLRKVWRHCDGFPGPHPASVLNRYVDRHHTEASSLYSAYPGATTRMVHAAFRVRDALEGLEVASRTATPEEFRAQWEHFLTDVQRDL